MTFPPVPTLHGDRLMLRPLTVEDATPAYVRWMNDDEVLRFTASRYSRPEQADLCRFIEQTNANPANVFLAMILKDSSRHVGNIKLGPISAEHRRGDIGILIGEKDCWGRGLAAEAISLLVTHAFETLGLHKLTAVCSSSNKSSARAFQKCGFQVEGVRLAHYWREEKWEDSIDLGMLNPAEQAPDR